MVYTVNVELDRRITLPADVLRELGIDPGTELLLETENERVVLTVKPGHAEPHAIFTRDIPPDKSVEDFLDEYEQKYQMTSEEFYRKYHAGELEEHWDFIDWIGQYETKLAAEKQGIDARRVDYERFVPQEQQ